MVGTVRGGAIKTCTIFLYIFYPGTTRGYIVISYHLLMFSWYIFYPFSFSFLVVKLFVLVGWTLASALFSCAFSMFIFKKTWVLKELNGMGSKTTAAVAKGIINLLLKWMMLLFSHLFDKSLHCKTCFGA